MTFLCYIPGLFAGSPQALRCGYDYVGHGRLLVHDSGHKSALFGVSAARPPHRPKPFKLNGYLAWKGRPHGPPSSLAANS
jgi:hypothetical protein